MDELRSLTRETVHLAVLDGLEVVYVERREAQDAVRMFGRIGNRGPAHATATGKLLLAFLPPDELDRRLDGVRLARKTPYTITSKEQLRGRAAADPGARLGRERQRGGDRLRVDLRADPRPGRRGGRRAVGGRARAAAGRRQPAALRPAGDRVRRAHQPPAGWADIPRAGEALP